MPRLRNATVVQRGREATRRAVGQLAAREAARRASFDTRRDPYYRVFWERERRRRDAEPER
jgi:hypothetical protein